MYMKDYLVWSTEVLEKVEADKQNLLIGPLDELDADEARIKEMGYIALAEGDKDNLKDMYKSAYNNATQNGNTPDAAKDNAARIVRQYLESKKEKLLQDIETKAHEIEQNYSGVFSEDAETIKKIMRCWNVKGSIKECLTEEQARHIAETYIKLYEVMGYKSARVEELMMFFPRVHEISEDTTNVVMKEKNHTNFYDSEVINKLSLSGDGFILSSTEYIDTHVDESLLPKPTLEEKRELGLLQNISPLDFRKDMFNSVIAEKEILDNCEITFCSYNKGAASISGIQVKYTGENSLDKFEDVCSNLFVSDEFKEILIKTSTFLLHDFVNYKDVLLTRIKNGK